MRPLSLDTDLPVLHNWIGGDSKQKTPLTDEETELLREAYYAIQGSDASQTFIGLVDDNPVCEIELYQVRQHAISLYYEPRAGDHYLDLLPAYTPQEYVKELLNKSLEYFFSYTQVERIMAEADIRNEWMNDLLKSVGFHWYQKIGLPNQVTNLYCCTHGSFKLAVRRR